MREKSINGHCLCGAIHFRVEGDPLWVGHCHCESCRRNTGSAVATFVGYRPTKVEYLKGERRFYQSSPGVRRGFCSDCGTPLSYEADKYNNEIHLYLCTLDEPEVFLPQFHGFYSERVTWFDIHDDLPRYDRTSTD